MHDSGPSQCTALLLQWRQGDAQALDNLIPLVYDELRSLASRYLKRERPDHTLQATALVHEAYGRLVNMDVPWEDRVHFFAIAARTMRRILVDHARARGRQRRGGDWKRESLHEQLSVAPEISMDFLSLDSALTELAEFDDRKSRAVELHYFGGLSYEEVAQVLSVSPATVDRDLRMAKAWLFSKLKENP